MNIAVNVLYLKTYMLGHIIIICLAVLSEGRNVLLRVCLHGGGGGGWNGGGVSEVARLSVVKSYPPLHLNLKTPG